MLRPTIGRSGRQITRTTILGCLPKKGRGTWRVEEGAWSAMTPLELIDELWAELPHACPYVNHDERGCFCLSPTLPEEAERYTPCDTASLQLWCLDEERYTRCHFYPGGDVP